MPTVSKAPSKKGKKKPLSIFFFLKLHLHFNRKSSFSFSLSYPCLRRGHQYTIHLHISFSYPPHPLPKQGIASVPCDGMAETAPGLKPFRFISFKELHPSSKGVGERHKHRFIHIHRCAAPTTSFPSSTHSSLNCMVGPDISVQVLESGTKTMSHLWVHKHQPLAHSSTNVHRNASPQCIIRPETQYWCWRQIRRQDHIFRYAALTTLTFIHLSTHTPSAPFGPSPQYRCQSKALRQGRIFRCAAPTLYPFIHPSTHTLTSLENCWT